MSSEDGKKPPAKSDVDASTTVSVDVADIPDARPDTVDGELPALTAAEQEPAAKKEAERAAKSDSTATAGRTSEPTHSPGAKNNLILEPGPKNESTLGRGTEKEPKHESPVENERMSGGLLQGNHSEPTTSTSEPTSSTSGSIDVSLSNPAIPEAVESFESQPVSGSGKVAIAASTAREGTGPVRTRRITGMVQDAVSAGVEKLGVGLGSVGEGVSKVGDLTKKVPLVGTGVGKLGEGLTKAGESIHALPRVAQTRRGRLLVRSVVVGFLLVFSWITVIVGFQLRQHDTPDFRPSAERILVQISQGSGSIGEIYERASPRFQELVRKDRFIDDMTDLNATNGKFREITAINETLVTNGPTGRVGRVSLTASYEKGIAHGSISFHYIDGQWKLLGIGIEVPRNVQITEPERQKRVAACLDAKGKDVSDQRAKCPVRDAAETILEKVRDGKAGEVWDQASDVFKQQETRQRFIELQEEHRAALGNYRRILTVTEARSIGGVTASFDAVAEFDKSSGVRVDFAFARASKNDAWQLRRMKVVVPMPRADEDAAARPAIVPPPPEIPPETPPVTVDAGATAPG